MATALFADSNRLDKLSEEIQKQYPQATIIRKSFFSDEVRKYAKPPELVTGDFDCNGLKDTVLQIYHEGKIKIIIVYRFKGKESKIEEIGTSGEMPLDSIKGRYENYTTLRKKGQRVEFYCDCGNDDTNYEDQELCRKHADRKSERGCSLNLDCDAIEEIYDGKAAVLYYFDRKTNKYSSVVTAD
jgi:hypothetical protein